MKTTFGTTMFGASGVMPPRWGWGFVRDVACYKHVAPLALSHHACNSEFARRVRAVEKLKTAQHASLAELGALFATLLHHAFCGEQELQRSAMFIETSNQQSSQAP